ncbi:MAG: hypothetical protein AMXMBFR48_14650 [Ignavibacteriales bacterium]
MKMTYLKGKNGSVIGMVSDDHKIYAKNGSLLGWYNPKTNTTHDKSGKVIGYGDLRTTLLPKA